MKYMKIDIIGIGKVKVKEESTLEDILILYRKKEWPIVVAALVNNKLKELTFKPKAGDQIRFVNLSDTDGGRIYQRGLSFLLIRSAKEVFENIEIHISHSLSKGYYFDVKYDRILREEDIEKIYNKMKLIVERNEPFKKLTVSKTEAKEIFTRFNMDSKKDLMDYREYDYINIYQSDWMKEYFFGYMVPSAGYLKIFDLMLYDNGIILRVPTKFSPFEIPEFVESPNISQVFKEYKEWASIMECTYVSHLNNIIKTNGYKELIQISEVFQEKRIAEIADIITKRNKRVVLIAGPSSSGKTTFANRLKIQLRVNGLKPVTLSTDDYFVEREQTPIDENGEYDFETIDAVDLDLFNHKLKSLLQGETVELPEFNFKTGKKEYNGKFMAIDWDQPIIIEGIHGLNPRLTYDIFEKDKFKIYISALTQLNIDKHNRIPTTDARLIRRIVRDNNYRGRSASETLNQWNSVRRGEEIQIFPYQEDADLMFNSAIIYELAIMKKHVVPLLEAIDIKDPMYMESIRLLKFLQYFESIEDDTLVPSNSILKEFIGGSIFR